MDTRVATGPKPIDSELCERVWRFVDEARSRLIEHRSDGGQLAVDLDVPKLERFASGFPHFSVDFRSGTTDYEASFVSRSTYGGLEYEAWSSWNDLVVHVEGNQPLRASFLVPDPGDDDQGLQREFFLIGIWRFAGGILDRVIRLRGERFSREQFLTIYCEREAGALRASLAYRVIVPLALTRFEQAESIDLPDGCAVVAMPEAMQLARMPEHPGPTSSANEVVVGAATHALIVSGLSMENCSGAPWPPYERPDWYPTEKIERFFDALRVVTGVETGYAQLCLEPADGWAFHFERDLPPVLQGPFVRRYPLRFDDFGWLHERSPVGAGQLRRVGEVMTALGKRPPLALAGRRLTAAMLREEDDDRILDLLIGLEALLGDGEKTEMTHKLALRTAAVLADAGEPNPESVAANVKRLYAYRSAVAHGQQGSTRKHQQLGEGDERVAASTLAALYLRRILLRLAERPDIGTGKEIDSKLIFERLGPAARLEAL